ncbi:hypothetical protein LTR27_012492 [Elasticomyces elasticus]|nr:hypothetical protein LTR27_012492 [Elasticomyces elasticus]
MSYPAQVMHPHAFQGPQYDYQPPLGQYEASFLGPGYSAPLNTLPDPYDHPPPHGLTRLPGYHSPSTWMLLAELDASGMLDWPATRRRPALWNLVVRWPTSFEAMQDILSPLVPEDEQTRILVVELIAQDNLDGAHDLVGLAVEVKKHCALMECHFLNAMYTDCEHGALEGDHSRLIGGLRQLLGIMKAMCMASHQVRHHVDRLWMVNEYAKSKQQVDCYEPQITGRLGNAEVSCLADRGAGRNIVSHEYVKRLGIPMREQSPSTRMKAVMGNGKLADTIGVVTLPFSFRKETEVHHLEFHVMPKCIRDYMGADDRVLGTLNGHSVDALPDTGSDVMLMSEAYAYQRDCSIDRDRKYQIPLQLANGTVDRTVGIVKNVEWHYGSTQDETLLCDFYVLPNMMCDVLLSYDFLCSTEAFTKHQPWFKYDNKALPPDGKWSLSTITKVPKLVQKLKQRLESKSKDAQLANTAQAPQKALQNWEREKRQLLREHEMNEAQILLLPSEQQDIVRATFAGKWQPAYDKHMRSRPGFHPLAIDGSAAGNA